MDTETRTPTDTDLRELAARANRSGFELNHRPGHIFAYQLVTPMVTHEGLEEMIEQFDRSGNDEESEGRAVEDPNPDQEKRFAVHLTSPGENKVAVIKVIKDQVTGPKCSSGTGLNGAKAIVERAPCVVADFDYFDEAEHLLHNLEFAGGFGGVEDRQEAAADNADEDVIYFGAETEVVEAGPFRDVRRTMHWLIGDHAQKDVQGLPFIGKDDEGRMDWWHVTPPDTDYTHAHEVLGRAYAFELLDVLHHPDRDDELVGPHVMRCVAAAMAAKACQDWRHRAIGDGFFTVIGEYLVGGPVNR